MAPRLDGDHPLFEWLQLVALAAGRGWITGKQASIAIFTGLSCSGTSAEGATINVNRLELELDIRERQIWRHFKVLCDQGWFEQTARPTRGDAGQAGRRARYRLTSPRLPVTLDPALSRLHVQGVGTTDDQSVSAESPVTSDLNHLSPGAESSVSPTPADGTVLPSVGNPSVGNPGASRSNASATGQAREERLRVDAISRAGGRTGERKAAS